MSRRVLPAIVVALAAAACSGHGGGGAPPFPDPVLSGPQLSRAGRPLTPFLLSRVVDTAGSLATVYAQTRPSLDADTLGPAATSLAQLLHSCAVASYPPLPDVLPVDASAPAGFANGNGRLPADDAFDLTLTALYTTSGGTCLAPPELTDHIDSNDVGPLSDFPYVGAPH